MYDIEDYVKDRGITGEMLEGSRARLEAYVEAYHLAEARKRRFMTQKQVAERMGVSQKRVSELERGDLGSIRLGTLRRYIKSLGGEFVGRAVFPEGTIEIH